MVCNKIIIKGQKFNNFDFMINYGAYGEQLINFQHYCNFSTCVKLAKQLFLLCICAYNLNTSFTLMCYNIVFFCFNFLGPI